jgi:hypothetical protein
MASRVVLVSRSRAMRLSSVLRKFDINFCSLGYGTQIETGYKLFRFKDGWALPELNAEKSNCFKK